MKILKNNYLSQEEQSKILARWKKNPNEQDRNIILENNFRLIAKLANDFCKKMGTRDIFYDLFQEGVVGAIMSIKTYDPEKGSFANWLPWWSRNLMLKWLDNTSFCMKLPNHVVSQVREMKKFISEYEEMHGVVPTDDKIKESFKIRERKMADYKYFINSEIRINSSFDNFGDSGCNDREVLEALEDTNYINPSEDLEEKDNKIFLRDVMLKFLSKTERAVLEYRNGFLGESPKTCKEIGEILQISKQRVNQIENKATRKLKKHYSWLEKVKNGKR